MRFERITVDAAEMDGQPCIRGMRLTVRRVLEAMSEHVDREGIRREHPELEDEDIRQALAYAAANLDAKGDVAGAFAGETADPADLADAARKKMKCPFPREDW